MSSENLNLKKELGRLQISQVVIGLLVVIFLVLLWSGAGEEPATVKTAEPTSEKVEESRTDYLLRTCKEGVVETCEPCRTISDCVSYGPCGPRAFCKRDRPDDKIGFCGMSPATSREQLECRKQGKICVSLSAGTHKCVSKEEFRAEHEGRQMLFRARTE